MYSMEDNRDSNSRRIPFPPIMVGLAYEDTFRVEGEGEAAEELGERRTNDEVSDSLYRAPRENVESVENEKPSKIE